MEEYDAALAARVWQRVYAGRPENNREDGLEGLIAAARHLTLAYRQLARQSSGPWQQLAGETQERTACLRGIRHCLTGEAPPPLPAAGRQPPPSLRHCYTLELQAHAAYQNRTADPEFGPVYALLSQQAAAHCRRILEQLGSFPKSAR